MYNEIKNEFKDFMILNIFLVCRGIVGVVNYFIKMYDDDEDDDILW